MEDKTRLLIAIAILGTIVSGITAGIICYNVAAVNTRAELHKEYMNVVAEIEAEYEEKIVWDPEAKSNGEINKDAYTVEIYDGTGQVVIKTVQENYKQMENGTLIIGSGINNEETYK